MYTFTVGGVKVSSSSATMQVHAQVDWIDDEGANLWQDVDIENASTDGADRGTSSRSGLTKLYDARLLDAPIANAIDLARHLRTVHAGIDVEQFLSAMSIHSYAWGKLLDLDWSALGFAPGGVSYFLLPHDLPCIDLRGLKLNWDTVIVHMNGKPDEVVDPG